MATSIADITSGLGSKPLSEYDWWKHHTVFFVVLFFIMPMVPTFYFGLDLIVSGYSDATVPRLFINGIMYVLVGVLIVTWFGSLVGYYFDAKYIGTTDIDWSPHWVLYTAVHVIPIFGALLAIPIYVFQRLRHVGLPILG